MITKTIFKEDKEELLKSKPQLAHIEEGITDPDLKKIDEMFGVANLLSIENCKKHRKNLKRFSWSVGLLVFLFLLYDEAELHFLILFCLGIIIYMYYWYSKTREEKYHEKYLQYRVLSESIRIQYFLSIACVKKTVQDLLPWFLKQGVPLIEEVLSDLPKIQMNEKKPIVNCWIKDQMEYHDEAHIRSMSHQEKDDFIRNISKIVAIITYFAAFLFEVYMFFYSPHHITEIFGTIVWADTVRAALKIVLGTALAGTLICENYYGKMSLSRKIKEHLRMSELYREKYIKIMTNKNKEEPDELIETLSRECLIENSTWYANQRKNDVEFSLG